MITLDQLTNPIAAFVFYFFCAYGLGKVLFRSFAGMEIIGRLLALDAPRSTRIREIQWSLKHNEWFDERRAQNDDMAAIHPLTVNDRTQLEQELMGLRNPTVLIRALRFFSVCRFCHTFWGTILVSVVTQSFSVQSVLVALAYGGLTVLLPQNGSQQPRTKAGCPDGKCG